MLTEPLQSIEDYIHYFSTKDIPVLRRSMRMMAQLQDRADTVTARMVTSEVLKDPMLGLRVLVYLESHRGHMQNHDITTIDRAIMMLGINPFFEKFGNLPTIEEKLSSHQKSLIGLLKVVGRSKNAAHWARDFAIARHDIDVDEITVAALLHEAAEILFWCFAPDCMLKLDQYRKENPGVRSIAMQQQILGVSIQETQIALVKEWHLPELLITLMNPSNAENPRVRNVLLACDLARHAANGWDDPALPDDYSALSELLHMQRSNVMHRIGVPEAHWQAAANLEAALQKE
jgi:HD-like signal output (HDOD) protein